MGGRPRRARAVGEYRRPRRVHHLLARRDHRLVEPADLVPRILLGPRRKVAPEQLMAQRNRPPTTEPHIERPGPAEFRDPLVRREMVKAAVWFGMALVIVGIIVLGQPLLLIVGGAIFAVFLAGGTRLLGHLLLVPTALRPRLRLV